VLDLEARRDAGFFFEREAMSEKLTPKQEKFAQGRAAGLSQTEAYRAAFDCSNSSDKTVHEGASRLAANSKVAARLRILMGLAAINATSAVRYELEDAMRECDEALAVAKEGKNAAAMARCVELKAKLNGLMVEDRKNQRRPLEELSDDQLEARITRLTGGAQQSVH
jgi:phage terminase small subunit